MIASLALVAALVTPAPQALPIIEVHAPRATLQLQVASTEQERELGLMSVTKLAPHTGMVFVFDEEQPVEFWMKDTLVPLDMVFVATDGTVRSVASKVPVVGPVRQATVSCYSSTCLLGLLWQLVPRQRRRWLAGVPHHRDGELQRKDPEHVDQGALGQLQSLPHPERDRGGADRRAARPDCATLSPT